MLNFLRRDLPPAPNTCVWGVLDAAGEICTHFFETRSSQEASSAWANERAPALHTTIVAIVVMVIVLFDSVVIVVVEIDVILTVVVGVVVIVDVLIHGLRILLLLLLLLLCLLLLLWLLLLRWRWYRLDDRCLHLVRRRDDVGLLRGQSGGVVGVVRSVTRVTVLGLRALTLALYVVAHDRQSANDAAAERAAEDAHVGAVVPEITHTRINNSLEQLLRAPDASTTPVFVHWITRIMITIVSPLVGAGVVALDVVDGGDAVEAADGEHHVVDDLDAEVAARTVHVVDGAPRVGGRVVALGVVQPRDAVEASCRRSREQTLCD